MRNPFPRTILFAIAITFLPHTLPAQVDTAVFSALKWREIGPFRGGRSDAVAGSSGRPWEYYFGTTGGGVFKTTDGGMTCGRGIPPLRGATL